MAIHFRYSQDRGRHHQLVAQLLVVAISTCLNDGKPHISVYKSQVRFLAR